MSQASGAIPQDEPSPFTPPALEELERMLPHYEVTGLIAHGGMGAVYSGVQRDLDRPVAIKVLPPEMGRDPESAERFRTEAKAMARLTHPHIPAVYEFAVVEDHCVIVMELVDGPNVYTLIRHGHFLPPQALEVMSQVCDAVQFAHARGIIHGDIKPGNIVLNKDGQGKLADFGLARLAGTGDAWSAMGTPEYAAPELYDKHAKPDYRADIYSLGVVLHEMLTGAPPVGEFELPAEGMGLDPRVDEVIAKCMEMRPEDRFASAADIRALLRDIIEGRGVPAPAPVKAATRKITRAGRRPPVVVKGPARSAPASQGIAGMPKAAGPKSGGPKSAGPKKRIRRKVVVQGGNPSATSRGSDGTMRGLLIGAAVTVIGIAAYVLLSGSNKTPPPVDDKPVVPDRAAVPIEDPASVSPLLSGDTVVPPPPPPRPPENKMEPEETPRVKPTKFPEKFQPIRVAWRDEWKKKFEEKFQPGLARTGEQYLQALQKFEDTSLANADTQAVIAVREERRRWESAKEAAATPATHSGVAKLQQQLAQQLDRLRAEVKYDADRMKERYLLALVELERLLKNEDDAEGAKLAAAENAKVTPMTDRQLSQYFSTP